MSSVPQGKEIGSRKRLFQQAMGKVTEEPCGPGSASQKGSGLTGHMAYGGSRQVEPASQNSKKNKTGWRKQNLGQHGPNQ